MRFFSSLLKTARTRPAGMDSGRAATGSTPAVKLLWDKAGFTYLVNLIVSNRKPILFLLAAFLSGFALAKLTGDPYTEVLKQGLAAYSKGEWVVKIDGEAIGKDFIDERASIYGRHIAPGADIKDPLFRDRLMRKLIDNRIIINEALKARLLSGQNARAYLRIFMEEALAAYYLDAMAAIKYTRPEINDKTIEDFYGKHESIFKAKNIPRDRALKMVRSGLEDISLNLPAKDRLTARRVELGRLKKGKKIALNHKLAEKTSTLPDKAEER